MKKLFLGAVVAFAVIALAACRIQQNLPGPDRVVEWIEIDQDIEFDRTTPVTINYWHRMGGINEAQFRQWVDEFTAMFPNISVNMHHTGGGYDDLRRAIQLELGVPDNDANMPDLMESYNDHILTYIPSGRPVALNNLITAPNISGLFHETTAQGIDRAREAWLDIMPSFRAEGQLDNSAQEGQDGHNADFEITGTVMALPLFKSTELLIFNRLLAEEQGWTIPTTWEGWNELSPAIREQNSPTAPNNPVFPIGYDSPGNWFITGMMQTGAPYIADRWLRDDNGDIVYNEEGNPVAIVDEERVVFNNEQAWNMTNFFRNMVKNNFMTTRDLSGVQFLSAVFVQGSLFASIGSTAGLRNSVTNVAVNNRVIAGLAPIPYFEGGRRTQIQQGPNVSMFYNNDQHRLIASWLFMQFITSTRINAEFVTAYNHPNQGTGAPGNIPSRFSVVESQTFGLWAEETVRYPNVPTSEIPAAQMLTWTLSQRENRIAFDAIMMASRPGMDFYVTPAFAFSSNMRDEAAPLINYIVRLAGTDAEAMPHIRARFQVAHNNVLGL